jgi:hypothetical protein
MFNQLTTAEVVSAIGTTLRGAARSDEQASDFERDQLMSAYSATRHLSVELATYPPELARFRATLAELLREHPGVTGETRPRADAVIAARGIAELGDALCELLAELRSHHTDDARSLRVELRVCLRQLVDRETELMADGLS